MNCFSVCFFFFLFMFHPVNAKPIIRSSNTTCEVNHGGRVFKEGDDVTINRKLFKVEDCRLQRAYQACGTHLWFMLNIVCEAVQAQKSKNDPASRFRRFAQEELYSEACCLKICTVTEMTRYCPS